MTRAQTLGLMAAHIWVRYGSDADGDPDGAIGDAVEVADALLREAERVSPEPTAWPIVTNEPAMGTVTHPVALYCTCNGPSTTANNCTVCGLPKYGATLTWAKSE